MGITVASKPAPSALPTMGKARSVNREKITTVICILTAIFLGVILLGLVELWLRVPAWQLTVMAAVQAVAWMISGIALFPRLKRLAPRIYLLISAMSLSMLGMAVLVDGMAVQAALVLLSYTILVTSATITGQSAERGLSFGILSAWVTSLAGLLVPLTKTAFPILGWVFPIMLGSFIVVYIILLALRYILASLRIRLILASLVIVLIPLLAVTFFQALFVQSSVTERIQEALNSAVYQTAVRVDDFLDANRTNIGQDATLPILGQYLDQSADKRAGSQAEKELRIAFQALQKRAQPYLVSYGLLDITGLVLQDFNPAEVGQSEGYTDYYSEAARGRTYVSNIVFSEKDQLPYVYFSSPVYFEGGRRPVGILRAKYNAAIFQSLLVQNQNLVGQDTSPILVDENYMRLGDAASPNKVYQTLSALTEVQTMLLRSTWRLPAQADLPVSTNLTELADTLVNRPTEKFFTTSFESSRRFVSVSRLNNKPWTVLYTQDASVLNQLSSTQQRTVAVVSCLLAGLIALISTSFAGAITQPITRLTETAEKISAGDLSVNAPVTNDEIGTMAHAFNLMTGRLREFVSELEDRVNARTQELAERNESLTLRSRQIQTISEVAHSIASTQNLETLLSDVTRLVSERFNFYHVGIFLIDENREFAVLRAANSEGGLRMLARQHKLKVGQVGIVGYVTGKGLPRIATDVGSDSVYFNNRDLPATRSEMALPLMTGDTVIGAIDVQSTQSNAFSNQDIELFSTLADQIAIAILNSRAFEETQHALEEARRVNQRYLHQEWNKESIERMHYTYEYTRQGVVARDRSVTPAIDAVFLTGEPVIKSAVQQDGTHTPAILGIPIKLRGETIGIIHLQDQGFEDREWAVEEIETVQSIADQVAQALENARLFEQIVRRADRERRVLEITGKIRSTTDPQAMLKIAVEELQRALHASKTMVIMNGGGPEVQYQNAPGDAYSSGNPGVEDAGLA